MYIFSMPLGEASRLASVGRYTLTILIGVLYIMMIVVLSMISESKRKVWPVILMLLVITFTASWMFVQFHEIRNVFQYRDDPTKRIWLEKQKAEYQIPEGESYAILIPKYDSGYFYYLVKYVFQSENIDHLIGDDLEGIMNNSAKYLIVYHKSKAIQKWIEENYPDQAGNTVIIRY